MFIIWNKNHSNLLYRFITASKAGREGFSSFSFVKSFLPVKGPLLYWKHSFSENTSAYTNTKHPVHPHCLHTHTGEATSFFAVSQDQMSMCKQFTIMLNKLIPSTYGAMITLRKSKSSNIMFVCALWVGQRCRNLSPPSHPIPLHPLWPVPGQFTPPVGLIILLQGSSQQANTTPCEISTLRSFSQPLREGFISWPLQMVRRFKAKHMGTSLKEKKTQSRWTLTFKAILVQTWSEA